MIYIYIYIHIYIYIFFFFGTGIANEGACFRHMMRGVCKKCDALGPQMKGRV